MNKIQEKFSKEFPDLKFNFDYPLAPQTYFKIGGPAEIYLEISDKNILAKLIKFSNQNNIKLTILGGASNVIISDEGVKGLILKLTNNNFSAQDLRLLVGAGIRMSTLVQQSIDAGFTGLEYFHGVPGNLGGAIYNNAHYLENLIGKHVARVEIINPQGEVIWINQSDCNFSYDHSRFQNSGEVIFAVEFNLKKGSAEASQELIKKSVEYRAKTQPLNLPSSGCIFQNVTNNEKLKKQFPQFAEKSHVPGGFLIDQAGLKGKKVGDIEVSEKHAAFFVNLGTGSSKDVRELIEIVKSRVREKFAVDLQEEVFFIGK
ncbi:MAG: UDP-N-acetylmuramate dehydrogenase [Patescibacteria group bacterium]